MKKTKIRPGCSSSILPQRNFRMNQITCHSVDVRKRSEIGLCILILSRLSVNAHVHQKYVYLKQIMVEKKPSHKSQEIFSEFHTGVSLNNKQIINTLISQTSSLGNGLGRLSKFDSLPSPLFVVLKFIQISSCVFPFYSSLLLCPLFFPINIKFSRLFLHINSYTVQFKAIRVFSFTLPLHVLQSIYKSSLGMLIHVFLCSLCLRYVL